MPVPQVEVLPPEEQRDPVAEKLAYWLDEAIPLPGGFRIGFDGLIGLVPGVGDLLGGLLSAIIIVRAAWAGVPAVHIARMVANVALDVVIGTVPLLGDLFVFGYKANRRNLRIYEEALAGRRSRTRDWIFLSLLGVALLGLLLLPLVILFWLIRLLLQ